MKINFLISLIVALLATLTSCNKSDTQVFGGATFIDQGDIPANVYVLNNAQMAVYSNRVVFVATSDGIWKNNLATKQWSRAGLDGKVVTTLYKHPTVDNKFYASIAACYTSSVKTLYISTDGCSSWTVVDDTPIDKLDGFYENFFCFAARPDNPNHIYANLEGGTMIAISTDGGYTWKRMNNQDESYSSYPCPIVFLPNSADQLYQGSECPLDDAWLGRYNIDETDPSQLTSFTKLVDMSTWSNRRPNKLQTFSYTGNSIYVGQEGALSKVIGTANKFIFISMNGENYPYTYVTSIWVDPLDTKHIVFGGSLNNDEQPMQIYETYNEGKTIKQYEDKLDLDNPMVMEIITTDTYPAIILNDKNANKVKLVLFKPAQ